jgi:hypothetical protein
VKRHADVERPACRDPSGSIDLDPSDLPGLKAMFTLCSQ